MQPLNYAILKFLTTVEEASTAQVMEALKKDYSSFKAFTKNAVLNALMTAEANGLLEESHFEVDAMGELQVYFRAPPEGAATINRYIKD